MDAVRRAVLAAGLGAMCAPARAQETTDLSPRIETVASEDGASFNLHIFAQPSARARAALVLLHGGGWIDGDATWVYARARRYAALGLVAVAVDYRLSGQAGVTPLEALADARASVRWTRANAAALNIDPARVGAYGVSAGGHLALGAALAEDAAARPSALVLVSPALDLERDDHFASLLDERAKPQQVSPLRLLRAGLPPTLILQGDVDTLTPLDGAEALCARMRGFGDLCELKIYAGYGHLFTPAGIDDRAWPQPDPQTAARAAAYGEAFLGRLGFMA